MDEALLKEYLEFAKRLANEAGAIMLKYFRSDAMGAQTKSDRTLVTLADTEINNLVIQRIKAAYPKHSIHGEEASYKVQDSHYTWVCDPVDGTMPFAKGLPISTFSIGLVDSDGTSILGVAYDPYQDRMYHAVLTQGAFLNNKKITVSNTSSLEGAYIDQELWLNEKEGVSFDDPRGTFSKKGSTVTVQCSAVITGCLVAEGGYDAMIFGQSKPEDIAALKVIVEEAGGRVTDLYGNDQRYDRPIYGAIVSNGHIHEEILDVIAGINYKSKFVERT